MENQLRFNFMLSLKEIALRRIGVAMCNKPSLFIKIVDLGFNQRPRGMGYHSEIIDNLSNLRLPDSLKKQMIPIIRAVCDEVTRWKLFHEAYLNGVIYARFFRYLCWTTAGTVNYQKTAEELVLSSDDHLDPEFCFQLACFYCLEHLIPELWRKLPVGNKKEFFYGDISQIKEPHLQLFLPNILERVTSTLNEYNFGYTPGLDPSSDPIVLAACLGNKTLFDYYFAMLPKGVKEATLVQTTGTVLMTRDEIHCCSFNIERNFLSSVSLHLLSLMTAEEQNRLFKELPCEIFGCFLDWPRQDLSLDIADVMWTFLPENKYKQLFRTLKCAFAYPDHYFRNVFHEFFQRSSIHFRKIFADGDFNSNKRFWQFISEDVETIRVVLRNLDPYDRVKFAFSEGGAFIVFSRQHNQHLMEVFFRELNLTKEEKWKMQMAVTLHAKKRGTKWIKENLVNFFEFVNEFGDEHSDEEEVRNYDID